MNMLDYVKWRGDLSFKQSCFNNVDALLMAYLAYVDYEGCMPQNGGTIKEISDLFYEIHSEEQIRNSKSFIALAPLCLKYMAESKRFKNCYIHNYVNIFNEEYAEQFSAITIEVPKSPAVIAFRGTDDTMVGWKEDFVMSYSDIPSQFDALIYLEKNVKAFKKYRVVGHSKGGNLAQYSVTNARKTVQNRIVQFINFDGPGLPEELFGDKNSRINQKLLKVVPEFDVFGTIYNNDCNRIVVTSDGDGIMAHNGFSWQIEGKGFVEASDTNRESKLIQEAFDAFINDTSVEQRSVFVDQFFTKLSEEKIETLSSVREAGMSGFLKVLKSVADIDEESREVGSIFIRKFSETFNEDLMDRIGVKKEEVKKMASDLKQHTKELIRRRIV